MTLLEHPPLRGKGPCKRHPHSEVTALLTAVPEIALYVENLIRCGCKVMALPLRQLLRTLRDYPDEAFLGAIEKAAAIACTIWTASKGRFSAASGANASG